jgi:hypothetical protein
MRQWDGVEASDKRSSDLERQEQAQLTSSRRAAKLEARREYDKWYRATHQDQIRAARRVQKKRDRARQLADSELLEEQRRKQREASRRFYAKAKATRPEEFLASKRATLARGRARHLESSQRGERIRYRKIHPLANSTARKLMASIMKALPSHMPPDVKGDVLSSVVLDVANGELRVRDAVPAVKLYITKHYREYDTHRNVSLDAVHPETGKAWIENLDSETRHF